MSVMIDLYKDKVEHQNIIKYLRYSEMEIVV